MTISFNVHDLFRVVVHDAPAADSEFLRAELGAFEVPSCESADLVVRYTETLERPATAVKLLHDLWYDDPTLIFSSGGKLFHANVEQLMSGPVGIAVQPGITTWHLFSFIEKLMQVRVLERGYAFLHGGGVTWDGHAHLVAAGQGGGKTRFVLDAVSRGAGFMADEQLLVHRSGRALGYPRRVNFKSGHGPHFDAACQTMPRRQRWAIQCQKLATRLSPLAPSGTRLHRKLSREPWVRQTVQRVFPQVVLADIADVEELIVRLPGETTGQSSSTRSRAARFLIQNAREELGQQMGRYARTFLTFSDPLARAYESALRGLLRQQVRTIARFVRQVPNVQIQEGLRDWS